MARLFVLVDLAILVPFTFLVAGWLDAGAMRTLLGLGWLAVTLAVFGAYATALRPAPALFDEARRLLSAFAWAAAGVLVVAALTDGQIIVDSAGVGVTFVWVFGGALAALCARRAIRSRLRRANPERILIMGAGQTGQRIAQSLTVSPDRQVVGFVDDSPYPLVSSLVGLPVYSHPSDIPTALQTLRPDRILVAFSRRPSEAVLDDLRRACGRRIPISVVPRYHEIIPVHAEISEIAGMPLIEVHSAALSPAARVVKRAFDIVLAGTVLMLASPVMLVAAVAVAATSRGPIFFTQMRMGQEERPFRIWKFRTMVVGAESRRLEMADLNEMDAEGPLFKIRRDPRVTRVGRILRRYSVDELPQLFNVLNGTMSMVGPRPLVIHEDEQVRDWHRRRLDLKPGITGLWQVRGRNDLEYDDMVRLDYLYLANWSPLWDLRLLMETIPRVLSGRGAS